MRIRSLDLIAFGPFRNKTLSFVNDGGVEVVFGPNEAGKSTTRRAVLGLLFGIPERSKDGHSVDEVRVGATLALTQGKTLEIVRRKGRKNTLLTPAGEPLDEQVIAGLVGGMDADTFEVTYGLDHTRLRLGGAALKVGNGDVSESLFSAATGLTGLHGVLVELRREAESLFVPRGTHRPLNEAQRSYAEAKKRASQLATPPDEWLKVEKQIEQARTELAALRAQRAQLATERAAAHAVVAAAKTLETNRARLAEIEPALEQARAELEALAPSTELLSRAQTIADLQERLGSHRKAQLDRPRVQAELEVIEERAAKARCDAPRGASDPPVEAHVRKLALEGAKLRERARQIEERELEASSALLRAEQNLAALEVTDDDEELREALELVQREGDIEARLAAARETGRKEHVAASARLGALGTACETLEELLALVVPSSDTIAAHARAVVSVMERQRNAAERRRRFQEEQADVERVLAALRAQGDVPSEEALLRARQERDAFWEAFRDGASNRAAGPRFERAMRDADELSDRLRREAARVTRKSESEAALSAVLRKLELALDDEKGIAEEVERLARAWASLWEASHLRPRSPEEMVSWLARHEVACASARSALDARRVVQALEAEVVTAQTTLTAALSRLTESEQAEGSRSVGSLARLAQTAKRVLAARDETRAARAIERNALQVAERKRDQTNRDRAAHERDRADWEAQWTAVTSALGLRATASPEEAEAATGALAILARVEDEADKARRRLAGIDRDAVRFAEDVRVVCNACAPELLTRPREEACAELARLVARATEQRARRESLEEQAQRLDVQARAARAVALRDEGLEPTASAEARVSDLDARLAELDEHIQHTSRHLGSVETGATKFDQSLAVEQAAEAQRQLARVRDLAERYARARLAASAVARVLDRYRRENQGPVLARASALFSALTLGTYEGLEVGFGESDEPVLVAVRDGRRLETNALSDGTLDQLYLALRVASLERLTAARGPLPLLLDDVLVHFDDQRAAAALAILSDLAKKTQVILFTHHARIVDIARRAISDRDGVSAAGIHDLAAL